MACRGRKRKRTFRQAALQVDEMDYADEESDFDPEEEAREAAAKKAPAKKAAPAAPAAQ